MSTSAAARGHRRSGSEEIVQQTVQKQYQPSAVHTYIKNLGTSVTGIALTRITGLQNYLRTPEKVKEGFNWVHAQVKKIGLPGAAAEELPSTTQQQVVTNGEPKGVPNGEPTTPPQQTHAPAAQSTSAPTANTTPETAPQQPVAADSTTESTTGIWSRLKEKLSNARSGASNFGNSVVEHFSVNRGWYGRAVGFAATYHAVDHFAARKIKNEYLRQAVSFGITTAFVWTVAVYGFKQEICAYDVIDTGLQVLATTKVIQYGLPLIKAGVGRLPNAPAWLSFRKAEVVKEKTA
jgi:hypothetical protein